MDFITWIIIVWLGLTIASILLKRWLIKETMKWDPFNWNQYMITELKCEKCGWHKTRYWAKGDFVGKEIIKASMKKHKNCDGRVFVTGIYWQRKMTKQEEKYNDLCRKWDKFDGIYI